MSVSDIGYLRFTIPGRPLGKGRPRFFDGKVITPKNTRTYEKHISNCGKVALLQNLHWRKICPSDRWFYLDLSIYHEKGRYPDADNVIKAIMDGLEGVIWKNDSRVIPRVEKIELKSANPRVYVVIDICHTIS